MHGIIWACCQPCSVHRLAEVGRHFLVDLDPHPTDARLLTGEHDEADDLDGHALRGLDHAAAAAAGAVAVDALLHAGANPLPRHLNQAEGAGAEDFGASTV